MAVIDLKGATDIYTNEEEKEKAYTIELGNLYRAHEAIHINNFFIGMLPDGNFRLTLSERNPDTGIDYTRASYLVSNHTLKQLCGAIMQVYQQLEMKQAQEAEILKQAVNRNRANATDIENS